MKTMVLMVIFLLLPGVALAGKDDKLTKHDLLEYDSATTGKPRRIKYVDVEPSDLNNKKVILRFGDSGNAHRVRVQYWYKTKNKKHVKSLVTGDNGWVVFNNLKNGKKYTFRMRGESNIGNGKWSKRVQAYP